jgi:hypothetical protein
MASGRRNFLAGVVAGGAAAVVTLSAGEASVAQGDETQSQAPEPVSRGYQRTAHVEAYYRSLRT